MKSMRTALMIVSFLAPGAALAQGGGHAHAAPNGGQIQTIGAYEGELVFKGSEIMLFVVDDKEQKVDATKLSATAVVLAKGNQLKSVEMKASGHNVLLGKIDFPVEGKLRATVTLKSGSAEVGKGRYNLDVK